MIGPAFSVPTSNGEILDKYSILEIKQRYIAVENSESVSDEIRALQSAYDSICKSDAVRNLYQDLLQVNEKIWFVMNFLLENRGSRSTSYLETVEESLDLNQERSFIKREINRISGSVLFEVKSYFVEES